MSNFFKRFFLFSLISLSFILISYLWNDISIPLKNNNQTVGLLTTQNYNPLNDTIRYLCIIGVSLFLYFFLQIYVFKKQLKINKLFNNHTHRLNKSSISFSEIKYYFFGILLLIFIQFISFDHSYTKLDYLHDGDYLTPAFNFISGKGIWSSAFSSHGGADIFYAAIAWKIFKITSVGSVKIFMSLFVIVLKIISVFFIFKLINLSVLDNQFKKFFFVILSVFLINCSNFDFPMNYSIISYRDIYYLFFFIFLIDFIYFRSNTSIYLISFISFLTPLLHIDTGIYLNSLFLLLAIYLITIKEFKNLFKLLSSYIISWFILFILVGQYEFLSFMNHLMYMAQHVDLVHGLRYPQPIFDLEEKHGFRATKGLLLQLLALIIATREIFFKDKRSTQDKIFLIFLAFMCFIAYKNALGRSDAQHIRMSSDFSFIILIFFAVESFLKLLQKKVSRLQLSKYLNLSIIALLILFIFKSINFNNLKKNESFALFIKKNDFQLLDQDSKKFIINSTKYFKNEECLFNFTTDISLPYFFKKKTCNKYFSPWLISGIKLENEYIKDLKRINHKYVIYSSPKYYPDNINTQERLIFVNEYLKKNYDKIYSENGFEILKKLN